MKRILATFPFFLSVAPFAAPLASAASLELTVTNVESASGDLRVAVFGSEEGWSGNEAITGQQVAAGEGAVTLTIPDLAPGEIGIKLYHDVDGDGELATGTFGMPSEPYGFSNDAPVRFGPPSWSKAKITITEGANTHSISLR